MKKRQWMMLVSVLALGAAGCGGDADGNDDAAETDAAAEQMADDVNSGTSDEGMADDATSSDGATSDGASQELPAGVTTAMIAEGKTVFEGAGICTSCHGPAGEGIPNLGANLTDAEWVHSDGSYEGIVQTVLSGVTAEQSSSGVPMPPKAATNITDAQVRAAAAYVWTLGH